jgi:hypothetical protein
MVLLTIFWPQPRFCCNISLGLWIACHPLHARSGFFLANHLNRKFSTDRILTCVNLLA